MLLLFLFIVEYNDRMNTHQDEAVLAARTYFPAHEFSIRSFGDLLPVQQFADALKSRNFLFGDRPDIILPHDDRIYLIEHFAFDSYQNNRKGSEIRIEKNRLEQSFSKIEPTIEGSYVHGLLQGNPSYQNYFNNAKKAFLKHYAKIDDYLSHVSSSGLMRPNTEIKMLFMIVDTSPLGNFFFNQRTGIQTAASLAHCPEFLSLFASCEKVDAVLSCSKIADKKFIFYIDRAQIDACLQAAKIYQDQQFISFDQIHVSGFDYLIPK